MASRTSLGFPGRNGEPSAGFRELSETLRVRVGFNGVHEADRVNHDVGRPHLARGVLEGRLAGVVAAVADDNQDFALVRSPAEIVDAVGDRIVERRPARALTVRQPAPQDRASLVNGESRGRPDQTFSLKSTRRLVAAVAALDERRRRREDELAVACMLPLLSMTSPTVAGASSGVKTPLLRYVVFEHVERVVGRPPTK